MPQNYDLKTGNLDDLVENGKRIVARGFQICQILSYERREIIYHFDCSENAAFYMSSINIGCDMRIDPNLPSAVIITHK